ncbi:MAG: aldo/keto reductase [Nitrososphaerota archaeon]|jgi:predicted aldo/keto reductase-like oxidoreductase|nr:aldo/keto reductase [Nitrososphaerota archaeon]
MQYRYVPKNGDLLSVLGFGCMRLPLKDNAVDESRAINQIRLAIDNGVNYIDTALPYHQGASEKILGKALQDGYRNQVKVATKLTPFMLQKPEDMQKMLNKQLETLQTDHIDYYLLHALDESYWEKMQTFGALKFLEQAQKDGKIINQAFSFHGSLTTFKEIVQANDWAMCQIQYNYLDEQLQAGTEGLHFAAAHKLAVVVMEPLRGGGLVQKLPLDAKQIFDTAPIKRSLAEWGLRWVWNHPEVTVALSGMNDETQVTENLKTAQVALPNTLTPNELDLITRAAEAYRRLLRVNCTGCQYCLPCPSGVNIPSNFQAYNDLSLNSDPLPALNIYNLFLKGILTGVRADAALCKKCLQCIKRCPQHINIPEKLVHVTETINQATANKPFDKDQ